MPDPLQDGFIGIPITLSPDQKRFLAHACAFIDTDPPQHELDKLLTLAIMLLPEQASDMLAKRAAEVKSGFPGPHDPQWTRWFK